MAASGRGNPAGFGGTAHFFPRRARPHPAGAVLPGYVQFLVDEPALNLALTQAGRDRERQVPAGRHHFGIEVLVEKDATCCYSRQDKFWAVDSDGHRWEGFFVSRRDHDRHEAAGVQGAAGDGISVTVDDLAGLWGCSRQAAQRALRRQRWAEAAFWLTEILRECPCTPQVPLLLAGARARLGLPPATVSWACGRDGG